MKPAPSARSTVPARRRSPASCRSGLRSRSGDRVGGRSLRRDGAGVERLDALGMGGIRDDGDSR
jgi:hypothetical protein